MAKNNKNRFKDPDGLGAPERKDSPRKVNTVRDPHTVDIKELQAKYNEEITSSIGPEATFQLAKITADVVTEEFKNNCTISRRKTDGNYRLYVTPQPEKEKSQGKLLVTVRKDFTFNVRLNPYNSYDKKYYLAENMDTKGLVKQFPTIKAFFANEDVEPDASVFKKETYARETA